MVRALLLGASLSLLAAAASDAQQEQPVDDSDNPVLQCLGIENDEERLRCFDRAVRAQAERQAAQPSATQAGGQPAVTEEAEVAERESRRFGLPRPSFPNLSFPDLFGGADREDNQRSGEAGEFANAGPQTQILARSDDGDIRRVMMTVQDVEVIGYDTHRFFMTNGQVWEETSPYAVRIPRVNGPLTVEIERGAVGGYLMRLDGRGRALRVRRVDS